MTHTAMALENIIQNKTFRIKTKGILVDRPAKYYSELFFQCDDNEETGVVACKKNHHVIIAVVVVSHPIVAKTAVQFCYLKRKNTQ